jgi:hypothetical protein
MPIWEGQGVFLCACDSFVPSGTWFHFRGLTQDLRPGLQYAAPAGLGFAGDPVFAQLQIVASYAISGTKNKVSAAL